MQKLNGGARLVFALIIGFACIANARQPDRQPGLWQRCVQVMRGELTAELPVYTPVRPKSYNSFFDEPEIVIKAEIAFSDTQTLSIGGTDLSQATYNNAETIGALVARYGRTASTIDALPVAEKIHTVVYPAVGHDAAAAFALFDRAELVIGIDRSPFVTDFSATISPVLKDEPNRYRGWTHVENVGMGEEHEVAAATIGLLKAYNPRLRILRVLAFQDDDRKIHGQIDFDEGPGTQVKTYIHLQGEASDSLGQENRRWWGQKLLMTNYRAVLIKAAMTLFGGQNNMPGDETRLVKKLGESGGLLLDGDADFHRFYDWSYPAEQREPSADQKNDRKIGYAGSDLYLLGRWAKPGSKPKFSPWRRWGSL